LPALLAWMGCEILPDERFGRFPAPAAVVVDSLFVFFPFLGVACLVEGAHAVTSVLLPGPKKPVAEGKFIKRFKLPAMGAALHLNPLEVPTVIPTGDQKKLSERRAFLERALRDSNPRPSGS
jgi:hypothetical protein